MSIMSPYYLPQITMPADEAVSKLDNENINYDYIQVNPNELNPSQVFTTSDNVGKAELNDMKPVWIDKNMNIIDGHHKVVRGILDNKLIKAIKIDMDFKDACRLLNKIEDIYEYEEKQRMEEVLAQDAINAENQINGGVVENEFLKNLEEDNLGIQKEIPSKNEQTVVAYRREPIKENSAIGNFFTLKPVSGFNKYEIDFENLLDTHTLGLTYKDSQNPIEILSKIWFPHVNFEKLSEQYNMPSVNLKNKAIAEKAQKLGYDGIKYGDTLIQGLK